MTDPEQIARDAETLREMRAEWAKARQSIYAKTVGRAVTIFRTVREVLMKEI